ncbi:MAG: segregation and condensation protein A [marine bacterium B5-7]|nr:MAG: segregation and condensation protein A [marine bacterium B5-7]
MEQQAVEEPTTALEAAQEALATDSPDGVIARVRGEAVTELPRDLYIPPDALEVFLDAFEGPLDLLLYLIKRHNLEILDIPIAQITRQYMDYVDVMKNFQLELAGEYLVMAAMLAEIKSRMLLPRPVEEDMDEGDPRAELVRRLQEYERFKKAGLNLEEMPRVGRDVHLASVEPPEINIVRPEPQVELKEILLAFSNILKRAQLIEHHKIAREPLSVRERMTNILTHLKENEFIAFGACFNVEEGRMGVVVSFIAVLELLKQSMIDIVQQEVFSPIHLKAVQADGDAIEHDDLTSEFDAVEA